MIITHRRLPWAILAVSAIAFEATALYFQHGLMLDPCELCIYQRVAMLGIFISAMIGMSAPRFLFARLLGYIGWGIAASWCLYLALKLSGIQLGFINPVSSCKISANFPPWLKLDEWLPMVFKPTGFCGDIQWQFFGMSIPQWLAIVMALQLLVLIIVIVIEVRSVQNK